METTHTQSLIEAGLSKDQASIYEVLVKNGPLEASKVQRKVAISRPLVYKVLQELAEIALVEKKDEKGKVAVFIAAHPLKLKEIVEKTREKAESAKVALDGVLSALTSDFNTVSGQPGLRFAEGISGLAELYEDILNEKKDLLLIRSSSDENFPETAKLVEKQIQEQVKSGIHTRALTPETIDIAKDFKKQDETNLVTRHIIPKGRLNSPAQIIVYGNKVAITSFQEPLITTIIENAAIQETISSLFENLWLGVEKEQEAIVKNIIGPAQDASATIPQPPQPDQNSS